MIVATRKEEEREGGEYFICLLSLHFACTNFTQSLKCESFKPPNPPESSIDTLAAEDVLVMLGPSW